MRAQTQGTPKGGAPKGGPPKGGAPKTQKNGARMVGPRRVEAQNFELFFPLQREPETPTCTFQGPGASNATKIPRENPLREKKRMKIVAGEGKKRAKFWAVRRRARPNPQQPQPQPPQAVCPKRDFVCVTCGGMDLSGQPMVARASGAAQRRKLRRLRAALRHEQWPWRQHFTTQPTRRPGPSTTPHGDRRTQAPSTTNFLMRTWCLRGVPSHPVWVSRGATGLGSAAHRGADCRLCPHGTDSGCTCG